MQNRSEADVFSSLLLNLRMGEEASYSIGHLFKAQDDLAYGQGFLAVGEMLKLTQINVTNLATRAMRQAGGFR